MTTNTDPAGKRRGIRASRTKLEHALAKSSLPRKTQAALANRIADLEGLEAAPKDLVSRVFREQPVDPQSIERVAAALGVAAFTLYFAKTDAAIQQPTVQSLEVRRQSRSWTALILGALAVIVSGGVIWTLSPTLQCRAVELMNNPTVKDGRLGIVIARFENDSENRAQTDLAEHFLTDPELASYLDVITTCDQPASTGPGDIRAIQTGARVGARERLKLTGAHMYLWGRRAGGRILVRFASARTDVSPVTVELGGKPMQIDESRFSLPMSLARPREMLGEIKHAALSLMAVSDSTLADLRNRALNSYQTSIDWLRASVISDRNRRRSINAETDPRGWAAINGTLCYQYRLLGDYDADPQHYEQAIETCSAALTVQPKDKFPHEWVETQINLGSAVMRLHAFEATAEEAVARLQEAENILAAALASVDKEQAPQLWATSQRNLGAIYLRLGELTPAPESQAYFEHGIELTESALIVLQPEFQPLDWAITQQNICVSLFQMGFRMGSAGIEYVREAVRRCSAAAQWLSPELTALTWAMIQNNLAASSAILATLEGNPEKLADAEQAFRQAQTVYTRARLPLNWAEVEINLSELKCNMAVSLRQPVLLDDAVAHGEAALEVFTEKGHKRYARYASGLLKTLDICDRNTIADCTCGPSES